GITNLEDAQLAVKLGADMVGFVFAKSPRKVTQEKAWAILKKLPKSVKKCAVFVNEEEGVVKNIQKKLRFDFLQFHGSESPAYCDTFKGVAKIIKAFRLEDMDTIKNALAYDADIYLFDAFVKGAYGGTGKLINLNLAKKLTALIKKPIMISGGLNGMNVLKIIKQLKPYAVDVSSGVERSPGKKDAGLLKEFVEKVRVSLIQ
ncbi:MAG: phosphoribosylanthranilate isomerase, partial [Candidatus Omnitrophota bacterium]